MSAEWIMAISGLFMAVISLFWYFFKTRSSLEDLRASIQKAGYQGKIKALEDKFEVLVQEGYVERYDVFRAQENVHALEIKGLRRELEEEQQSAERKDAELARLAQLLEQAERSVEEAQTRQSALLKSAAESGFGGSATASAFSKDFAVQHPLLPNKIDFSNWNEEDYDRFFRRLAHDARDGGHRQSSGYDQYSYEEHLYIASDEIVRRAIGHHHIEDKYKSWCERYLS